MTKDGQKIGCQPQSNRPRGIERRVCTRLLPPPYLTKDGVVLMDRRTYLDRRAAWIRDFQIDQGSEKA